MSRHAQRRSVCCGSARHARSSRFFHGVRSQASGARRLSNLCVRAANAAHASAEHRSSKRVSRAGGGTALFKKVQIQQEGHNLGGADFVRRGNHREASATRQLGQKLVRPQLPGAASIAMSDDATMPHIPVVTRIRAGMIV
eukprot:2407365-Pleurochrysis_carterae.AAC.1